MSIEIHQAKSPAFSYRLGTLVRPQGPDLGRGVAAGGTCQVKGWRIQEHREVTGKKPVCVERGLQICITWKSKEKSKVGNEPVLV